MMESEPWERFWVSGRIEDYLLYAGMAEKPGTSAVNVPAIRDESTISGKAENRGIGWSDTKATAKQKKENQ